MHYIQYFKFNKINNSDHDERFRSHAVRAYSGTEIRNRKSKRFVVIALANIIR